MGLLQTFTGDGLVGAGVSLLGGVLGSSSSSPSKQYKYQKKLMNLQNAYNQQNATIAYDRSRQLTQDSALLEKLGKQQAGINTAFGQNGSVSSSSSAPQADAVSIPSGPDVSTSVNALSQGVQNAVSNLLATATTNANVRKLNAEAEGTEIDNMSRNYLNMKKAGLLSAQAAKTFKDAAYQSIVNKYADSRLSAEANKANSDALIASADSAVRGQMNKANYDNLIADTYARLEQGLLTEKQALTEIKKWSLMRSEEQLNFAKSKDTLSHVGVNITQSALNRSNVDLNKVDYYVKNATKADVIKAAQLAVKEHGPQSISDWSWSVFNNWENASDGAKTGAIFALIPQIFGTSLGGAASSASSAYGNEKGKQFATKKPKKIGFH